jgi:hypothetical protein
MRRGVENFPKNTGGVGDNQRGWEGNFLRPISQELCYIYLPMHIQYPSSKIRPMQIFIISPLKTTFMT